MPGGTACASFRLSSERDFFRGEAGLLERGDLFDDGDISSQTIKAIKAFVEEHQAERARGGETVKTAKREAGQEGTRREEREFWERMASIISDKTFRVWNALEKALHKYNALTGARAATINEVAELQQQNGELKALLNQYLSSRINEDLHIPPTQVIQLDNYESFQ